MLFGLRNTLKIGGRIAGLRRGPLYVQYYITARCNLTCKQCNIIYANADVPEATLDQVVKIAENLRRIGTTIVLLTGGEPFIRKDIADIIRVFVDQGIHVRTQTNGLATLEQLRSACEAGARDISISLDSLSAAKQDFLNGSHSESWVRALRTISAVTHAYPVRDSFAAFGTVLSPLNILEIPNVIRFATEIGWYVSLVPAHIASPSRVFNFRSYDREMIFSPSLWPIVDSVLDECLELKRQGLNLYDSVEYIRNIKSFIRGKPVTWRRRNNNICDSPGLYFAIRPNGDLKVCCDHILSESVPVWHPDFPTWYKRGDVAEKVLPTTSACSGCMYGSFPEMSIAAHFPLSLTDRFGAFWKTRRQPTWPISVEKLVAIAERIGKAYPVDEAVMTRGLEAVASHAEVTLAGKTNSRLRIKGTAD